jgi:hypothetical protein
MRALTRLVTGSLVCALMVTQVHAGADAERDQKADDRRDATGDRDAAAKAQRTEPDNSATAASPKTGGDTKPNAVDPAQGTTTGANVGEGASYSRSTEKGQSTK